MVQELQIGGTRQMASALGKGEVVSSILTGSTISGRITPPVRGVPDQRPQPGARNFGNLATMEKNE